MSQQFGGVAPLPPQPTPGRERSGDMWGTLVLTIASISVASVLPMPALFVLMFFDSCPPPDCHATPAVSFPLVGPVVTFVVAVVGSVLAYRRRRAGGLGWPVAVFTLVVTAAAAVLTVAGFGLSVGW